MGRICPASIWSSTNNGQSLRSGGWRLNHWSYAIFRRTDVLVVMIRVGFPRAQHPVATRVLGRMVGKHGWTMSDQGTNPAKIRGGGGRYG